MTGWSPNALIAVARPSLEDLAIAMAVVLFSSMVSTHDLWSMFSSKTVIAFANCQATE